MIIAENTPTRAKAIQADIYAEYGQPEHTFNLPRPFDAEHFGDAAKILEYDAAGFAHQSNQVLAENLSNNLSSRIKSIYKFNTELAIAQEEGQREDEESKPLPTQADLDILISAYDFSGIRAAAAETVSLTPVQKEMVTLVKKLVRNLLRASGLSSRNLSPPVTVAKKNAEATGAQVSFDEFLAMVEDVVEGEGVWGEELTEDGSPSPYYAKRAELLVQAKSNVAAVQMQNAETVEQLQAAA